MRYDIYTGCNRRNEPDFGRVFLGSNYTDINQKVASSWSSITNITNDARTHKHQNHTDVSAPSYFIHLTLWRRIFFLILAHPVYKM